MRRSAAKTYVRRALEAIASGDPEGSAEAVRKAISSLDRAAQGGAIHRNSADRRKARLMRKYNLALVVTAASEEAVPTRKPRAQKEKSSKVESKKRGGKKKK